jgi:hypothetical protein
MRCFLERLFFQYLKYDKDRSSAFEGKIQGGFIYTMNAAEDRFSGSLSEQNAQSTERMFKRILHGDCESLFVFDTMQFADYSIYETSSHDPIAKLKRREEVFPFDCQKAFDLGARLVQKAGEQG